MIELQEQSIIASPPTRDYHENLIEQENKKTHQIFKNRLFLTSILSSVIFALFLFSMVYYDWATVGIPLKRTAGQIKSQGDGGLVYFKTNLLYAKPSDSSAYLSFAEVSAEICPEGDYYCTELMSQFRFVGALCFFILISGSIFQMYDLVRTLIFIFTAQKYEEESFTETKQDNLRHILTIALFMVGITLNIFSLAYMDIYFHYGVSFWIFVSGIICFIVIIIYEQISLSRLGKQKMVLALIKGEKKLAEKMNGIGHRQGSSQYGDGYI